MDQLDLFATPKNQNEPIKINNGEYIYIENFFNRTDADFFLKDFIENITWEQQSMNMYGKLIPFPRLTTWY